MLVIFKDDFSSDPIPIPDFFFYEDILLDE